jgi:hypothetical protein
MTSPQQRRVDNQTRMPTSPSSTISKIHSADILADVRYFKYIFRINQIF